MISSKQIRPDSTAFALNIKNFGYLPGEMQSKWSSGFLNARSENVPLPKRLIVELVNTCNYDCPMCRVGRYGVNLSRRLPIEDFTRILDDLKASVEEVRLNGLGESTLLPDFPVYVQELIACGIKIELISNGSGRLDDYELILRNNGVIIISWDSSNKKNYEILRRPAIWEERVEQLVRIAKIAEAHGNSDRLFIMFTLQKMNLEELPDLVNRCHEWGIANIIVNVVKQPQQGLKDEVARIKQVFQNSVLTASTCGINLMLPDQLFGVRLDMDKALPTSSGQCTMPWEEAVLRWNGDVQVCNMFNPYTYGNIYLNSFQKIWNNAFAQVFRDNLNTENRHPYCQDCVYMRDVYASKSV